MTRPVRRWFFVIAAAAWLTGCATPANWPLLVGQHPQSFSGVVTKRASGQFLLYLPKDFVPHGSVKYPLLVFLHGSGESGHDIEKVKINGPPKFLDTRGDFPFIVASPQAPAARFGFDFDAMNLMLNELLRQLPIDPDRVYLTPQYGRVCELRLGESKPGAFRGYRAHQRRLGSGRCLQIEDHAHLGVPRRQR